MALEVQSRIVDETIEYYRTNERGREKGTGMCKYHTENGASCGVGRLTKDPEAFDELVQSKAGQSTGVKRVINTIGHDEFIKHLVDEDLKKLPQKDLAEFLYHLQYLHDADNHWKANGSGGYDLTIEGKAMVESMWEYLK